VRRDEPTVGHVVAGLEVSDRSQYPAVAWKMQQITAWLG
jgi:hypothetical protein